MTDESFEIEQREDGYSYVIDNRHSPVYATRELAAEAARAELESREKADNEEKLETGLEDTFPASDPVAVTIPGHAGDPDHEK
ncbi:hypothetical protein [Pseudohoeflea coraliihabitans]|uniref:DUF2188 domain-containing protein n=1 Tax=Pseudohoeflea coraliihabitans TaxID=2860393 RepID=A0ABS6WRI7_9HYPH|nr:hypothetical protein [Pseudohoeflea sp. DP4N28-3]MBW3098589.1 hypothetical protein [Pseudohoeflea sp. DP4N28-3]